MKTTDYHSAIVDLSGLPGAIATKEAKSGKHRLKTPLDVDEETTFEEIAFYLPAESLRDFFPRNPESYPVYLRCIAVY